MRVLIACEFSGVVRDAFRNRGHDAWSCDLIGPDRQQWPNYHLEGNCLWWITGESRMQWDLLIAHPPCTYLCNSGVRWLYGGKGKIRDESRWQEMERAAAFFRELLDAPVARIAVENPVMHGHAVRLIGSNFDQSIQPWQFGHGEVKRTCLWLKNLPLLRPTQIVAGRKPRVHHASPSPNRWKERSRTLAGIAEAMADQWGNL